MQNIETAHHCFSVWHIITEVQLRLSAAKFESIELVRWGMRAGCGSTGHQQAGSIEQL